MKIGNYRYVVQGRRDEDGRVWAIHATDSLSEAKKVLGDGVVRNGSHWTGVRVWDRRRAIMPPRGWDDVPHALINPGDTPFALPEGSFD